MCRLGPHVALPMCMRVHMQVLLIYDVAASLNLGKGVVTLLTRLRAYLDSLSSFKPAVAQPSTTATKTGAAKCCALRAALATHAQAGA